MHWQFTLTMALLSLALACCPLAVPDPGANMMQQWQCVQQGLPEQGLQVDGCYAIMLQPQGASKVRLKMLNIRRQSLQVKAKLKLA